MLVNRLFIVCPACGTSPVNTTSSLPIVTAMSFFSTTCSMFRVNEENWIFPFSTISNSSRLLKVTRLKGAFTVRSAAHIFCRIAVSWFNMALRSLSSKSLISVSPFCWLVCAHIQTAFMSTKRVMITFFMSLHFCVEVKLSINKKAVVVENGHFYARCKILSGDCVS